MVQQSSFILLHSSEPTAVGPSFNLTVATVQVLVTMEILHCNCVWVCNTAANTYIVKSKDGAYNSHKVNLVSQGMIGGHIEVSLLMDFMLMHNTREMKCTHSQ